MHRNYLLLPMEFPITEYQFSVVREPLMGEGRSVPGNKLFKYFPAFLAAVFKNRHIVSFRFCCNLYKNSIIQPA